MPARNPRRSVIPKASDVVAADLRQTILGGRLAPGTQLPTEGELMDRFGLGRGTIREAFRLLESEGLIAVKRGPHGGAVVARPDLSSITRSLASLLSVAEAPLWQLTGFRNVIEPAAAAMAAERATPEQRDALLAAAEDTAEYRESGPPFHTLIADSTNHELFRVVLYTVYQLMLWHHTETFSGEPRHESAMRRAHRKIAAAIARGDAAGAEKAMHQHVVAEERILAEHGGIDRPIVPDSAWSRSTSLV